MTDAHTDSSWTASLRSCASSIKDLFQAQPSTCKTAALFATAYIVAASICASRAYSRRREIDMVTDAATDLYHVLMSQRPPFDEQQSTRSAAKQRRSWDKLINHEMKGLSKLGQSHSTDALWLAIDSAITDSGGDSLRYSGEYAVDISVARRNMPVRKAFADKVRGWARGDI